MTDATEIAAVDEAAQGATLAHAVAGQWGQSCSVVFVQDVERGSGI